MTVRQSGPAPLFVISLPGSSRRTDIACQLERWPGEWSFFDAVDGASLSPEARSAAYDERSSIRNIGRPLSAGEIGCAMSHAALYRKIVADGLDRAFVIEDDVKLLAPFFDFASRTVDWDFDVISFYSARAVLRRCPAYRSQDCSFHRVAWLARSTCAYLVSREGARKLEAATRPIVTEADWPIPGRDLRFFVSFPFMVEHSESEAHSIIAPQRELVKQRWHWRVQLPKWAEEWIDVPATGLFIRYLMNRDRYDGVGNYIRREIAPFLMGLMPFLYRSIRIRR